MRYGAIDLRSGRPQHRGDGLRRAGLQGRVRRPLRRGQDGGAIGRIRRHLARHRRAIRALRLDLKRVKLYQDSLPVCGHERALVHDLAAQGSRNHQLLEALAEAALRSSAPNRRRCFSRNTGCFNRRNAPRRRPPLFSRRATDSSPVESTRRLARTGPAFFSSAPCIRSQNSYPRIKVEYLADSESRDDNKGKWRVPCPTKPSRMAKSCA